MTTLTSTATFAIGNASTVQESVTIPILPAASSSDGRGRLVHPTLGAYDYTHMPDEWENIDGDLIVAPAWSNAKTLRGSQNTLMPSDVRDVEAAERWTWAVPIAHLRSLLLFWQNPPDPADGYVEWWPNYTSSLGFYVALVALEVGGHAVTLDWVTQRHDMVVQDITLRLRVVGRIA